MHPVRFWLGFAWKKILGRVKARLYMQAFWEAVVGVVGVVDVVGVGDYRAETRSGLRRRRCFTKHSKRLAEAVRVDGLQERTSAL